MINKSYWNFPAIGLLMLLGSCSDEVRNPSNEDNRGEEIRFGAYAEMTEDISTRALSTTTIKIGNSYYGYDGVNFHIYTEDEEYTQNRVNGSVNSGKTDMSSYYIPSLYDGVLIAGEDQKTLNWFSRSSTQYFWSWTTPWDNENHNPAVTPYRIDFKDTYISETNQYASSWNEGSWANGACLDKLIAACVGPLSYESNGQYVELQYKHLISKVLIGEFVVIDNSTATVLSNLKGNLTIYGMPRSAMFYPTPVEFDDEGNLKPGRPYVAMDEDFDYSHDESVTYALTNYSNKYFYNDAGTRLSNSIKSASSSSTVYYFYDIFNICPEVDFSKLSFKIEIYEYKDGEWILSREHGNNGAFYGDFKNIKFTRNPGDSNYDNPDGGDDYILHAGEYLQLGINLNSKGNPSMRGEIFDWSQRSQNRNAVQHDRNGIWTMNEGMELSDAMKSGDRDKIEEFFDIFGSGENTDNDINDPNYGDNLDIFKLYDDVGSSGTSQNTYDGPSGKFREFQIADGYILDGLGHTINFATTTPSIGHMRDVFLRYHIGSTSTSTGMTTHTVRMVYIDPYGEVWLVDPETFQMTDTGNNVNNATRNPFTINLGTGAIS